MNSPVKNILIVFGTRPEIIKIAPLIQALKDSPLKDDFILVSTSQHEAILDEQLDYWKIIPDFFLTSASHNGNLTRLLTHTINGLQDIIEQFDTIEYVIVQGDTNTALAAANLSFLNKLKLVHIEAGLRSHNNQHPFPEEFNRKVAAMAAYFHFAPTETAKNNLLNEGIDSSKIRVVGNTVIDALQYSRINNAHFDNKNVILITLHRRENIETNYRSLIDIIDSLSDQFKDLKFVWVTHPNCSERVRKEIKAKKNIEVLNPMPYHEFIRFYNSAKMVITDSGGVSEEAIHLGLPIIVFRENTERPEAFSVQYPMIVSMQKDAIISFFRENVDNKNEVSYSYGEGNAAQKIVAWLVSETDKKVYDTLIIGGGPAGTGILLKELKDGEKNKLFDQRIALIEKSSVLICGNITQFKVNSDTLSDVFLECLEGATAEYIGIEKLKKEMDLVQSYQGKAIPLNMLNGYFNSLGILLKEALESSRKCEFKMNSQVSKIIQNNADLYEVYLEGSNHPLVTRQVIIATGGIPRTLSNGHARFAERFELSVYSNKTINSDTLLKSGLPDNLRNALLKKPQIVILGGSHSAFSAAYTLLSNTESFPFEASDIKIWTDTLPKIFFNSREDALAVGYTNFTDDDFCPVTKKLYRLAGLRMDGRELYLKMLGLGYAKKEDRVKINLLNNRYAELEEDLKNATLIITAFGYAFNMIPFFDKTGNPMQFIGSSTGHWVNDNCEILDVNGSVIPKVFATGLATGFIPNGELGGEPGFKGQTNGIWYYQNAIAERVISILAPKTNKLQ